MKTRSNHEKSRRQQHNYSQRGKTKICAYSNIHESRRRFSSSASVNGDSMFTKLLFGESGTHTGERCLLLLTPCYFVPRLTLLILPVAQTPRNTRVFVAVCSSYWNCAHISISESIDKHLAAQKSYYLIYEYYMLID